MTPKQVKEIFDKLPSKRRKVLLGFLAGHSREKIMVDADVPSDAALTGHLKELYKNFRIDTGWNDADDRRSGTRKLPLLISLFARCMPELLSNRISEVPNGVEQKEAIAKLHRKSVESDAGSIEERYFRATSNFDSLEPLERKSRIQVLEEIARDSPRYHWQIMGFLAAFVRAKASRREEEEGEEERSPKIPEDDIQAALTVIGRRNWDCPLNLSNTDIRGADLKKANLQGAKLNGTNLQRVDFQGADLQGAFLDRADLKGASLTGAKLQGAILTGANLQEVLLPEANLQMANLIATDLEGALLRNTNIEGALLRRANLQGVFLRAKLKGADLTEADLRGVDLSEAKNLDLRQIKEAFGDSTSILPENVVRPAHWK